MNRIQATLLKTRRHGLPGALIFMVALLVVLMGMTLPPESDAAPAEAAKTELLEAKLKAMEVLRGQIGVKLIEASAIRNRLATRIEPLELEIRTLSREQGLATFPRAGEHPDIHFGVKSLAYFYGYYDAVQAAIVRLREADHALQYLLQQGRDDLEVIATLSDFAIDALVTRIDRALDFPEARQAHLIDAVSIRWPEASDMFKQIITAR